MKKSTVAILCASALTLSMLAACGTAAPEESAKPSDEPTASEEPTTKPEGAKPENITNTGEKKNIDVSVEGQTVSTEMTKYTIDLGEGMSADIFVDAESYGVAAFEDDFKICPLSDCNEPDCYVSIDFVSGKTADVLAEQELGGRRDGSTVSDEGMCKIGDYDAYHVQYTGKDYEYYEHVYFITGDNGTVVLRMHLGGESIEGHSPRFEAMMNTLVIAKASV